MDRIYERDITKLLHTKIIPAYPRGTRFQYEPVEPSAGTPARLFVVDDDHGRTSFPGLDLGMLGWTRKETYRTLVGIVAGMEAQKLLQAETIRGAADQLRLWSEERMSELMGERQKAETLMDELDKLAPPTEF